MKLRVLAGLILLAACAPVPKPAPGPTPAPTPVPSPPPTPSATVCPLQPPLIGYGLGLRIGAHGTPQQKDATPFIQKGDAPFPPPGWTGTCRVNQCDLGSEKDPLHGDICTTTLCGPTVVYSIEPPEAGIINWVQGYTVKITMNAPGHLLGACSVNPNVRTSIEVGP